MLAAKGSIVLTVSVQPLTVIQRILRTVAPIGSRALMCVGWHVQPETHDTFALPTFL